MNSVTRLLVHFCFAVVGTADAAGPYIAYSNPTGPGNQSSQGVTFGMDFNVNSAISVSALGAFDSDQDGLTGSITVAIWDRTTKTVVPGLSLVITGTQGTFRRGDGDRIVPLPSPVILPAGFQGSIVASGYGVDLNGNAVVSNREFSITDTGGGLISFVKGARQGSTLGAFPTMVSNTPFARQYGGPTFVFDQKPSPPPPPFLGAINHWVAPLLISIGLILVFMMIRRLRTNDRSRG